MSRSFIVRSFVILLLAVLVGLIGLALLPHLISVEISASPDIQNCSSPFIAVKNTGLFPIVFNGWKLEYEADSFSYTIPNHRLSVGRSVRIWSGAGQNDPYNLYAGRSEPAWSLNGLVVHGKIPGGQERFWTEHCRLGQ